MKPDVRNTWTFDLRSGNFCQGTGNLRIWSPHTQEFEYCCLGILCERSGLADWEEFRVWEDGTIIYSYLDETQYLPLEVAQWAGLDFSHAEGRDQCFFIDLNDNLEVPRSFPEIADEAEARFP